MSKKPVYLFLTLLGVSLLTLAGCAQKKNQKKKWTYKKTLSLQDKVHPMSIVVNNGALWISVPAQKKLLHINKKGETLDQKTDLPRPMHITARNGKIYIPLYLEDRVISLDGTKFDTLNIGTQPDAPAGVAVKGDMMAVADFYNHRIILQIGNKMTTIGKKGHHKGQLFYPTDIAIAHGKIYVADAYNNRAQVFSPDGKAQQIIGTKDSINVATGIAVSNSQIFVTDFYHDKILVYDLDGNLTQTLTGHFDKPTDISLISGDLYIPNYGGYSVAIYTRKQADNSSN